MLADKRKSKRVPKPDGIGPMVITLLMFIGVVGTLYVWTLKPKPLTLLSATDWVASPLPLVMTGGDPYLRALMRTISAAESNTADPYRLLYGGDRVKDLSVHPDECVRIVNGPNQDDCTTAAGRYQFLTTTWEAEAARYHPDRPTWYEMWQQPSFEPEYQDAVVYGWLADKSAWGEDIAQRLQAGDINQVLELLSGTWTSLGYGIEDNSMSALLPQIYDEMLAEELAAEPSAKPATESAE
ncbi:MAG: glycoside hydrolase [Phormidesmis priestleyi]|uniref:Glycoside hydrolase n=1 Tax=Phormidesmis priestleyi TaxID=268141 RepID=A0A2W4XDK1_9CYAN|nr:MAG: glycoside hydrolase [Phormidesmis priestleyi]